MRTIPIAAVPSQSLSIRVDNVRIVLRIKEANGVMIADVERDNTAIISGTRVLAGEPIIPYRYLEEGNFLVLTIDDELPDWREFGISQSLIYITADEVAALHG
jgi:hypothetical protein